MTSAAAGLLVLVLAACGQGGQVSPNAAVSTTPSATPTVAALPNAPAALITPTYDGSGQAMHPSIIPFPQPWHGYKYWMGVTPYPDYDATKENPSLLVSNDGLQWQVPDGLANPIASGPGTLADDELFYDSASDQLWMFYLWKNTSAYMMRMTSTDGIHWSAAQTMFSEVGNGMISPAVDKIGNTYYAWYVDAAPLGSTAQSSMVKYRTSSDGINWSASQVTNISQPGYVIWHIEVRSVKADSERWMVAAAYPVGSSSGATILFFNTSSDGVNWTTYGKPALKPGTGWDAGQIYRSTFLYEPSTDLLRVWYSARSAGTAWHTGYTQESASNLLQYLRTP